MKPVAIPRDRIVYRSQRFGLLVARPAEEEILNFVSPLMAHAEGKGPLGYPLNLAQRRQECFALLYDGTEFTVQRRRVLLLHFDKGRFCWR